MGEHLLFMLVSATVTFTVLLALVRWIGETQISQATYFNWVAGACMGNIAASMIQATRVQDVVSGGVELVIFSAVTILASILSLKSRAFRRVASGEPIVLIHKGRYVYDHLKKSKIDVDLMKQLLREQGYFDYRNIEYAILEPTGSLSVLPMKAPDDQSPSVSQTQNPTITTREESNHIK